MSFHQDSDYKQLLVKLFDMGMVITDPGAKNRLSARPQLCSIPVPLYNQSSKYNFLSIERPLLLETDTYQKLRHLVQYLLRHLRPCSVRRPTLCMFIQFHKTNDNISTTEMLPASRSISLEPTREAALRRVQPAWNRLSSHTRANLTIYLLLAAIQFRLLAHFRAEEVPCLTLAARQSTGVPLLLASMIA